MASMMRLATGVLFLCMVAVAGDRAAWRSISTMAAIQSRTPLQVLVTDAFVQARGVAPGSPGFAWDRVRYVIAQGDFSSHNGDEIAIGGTVLPEDGFLVLYATDGGTYKKVAQWSGLACVEGLRAGDVAPQNALGGPHDLVITHSYDEMIGALFRWQRLLYLRYLDGRLQPLLELVTLDEAYSMAPPCAQKARLDEEVVAEKPGWLETVWEVRHWDRMSNGEYTLKESRQARTVFQWDPVANRLAPVPGSLRP